MTKVFLLTVADLQNASVYQGQPKAGKPDCTLTLADGDMVQIVSKVESALFIHCSEVVPIQLQRGNVWKVYLQQQTHCFQIHLQQIC